MAGNYYLVWDSDHSVTTIGAAVGGGGTAYTPTTSSDWSPAPTTVPDALDQLASRVKALESAAGLQIYACPSGATVGQAVYETGSDFTVALANATDLTKSPAIGIIGSKPTSTTCTLTKGEVVTGGTLTDGALYYLGTTDGGVTATAPNSAGNVVQRIGRAVSTTKLFPLIDGDYTVRA